MVQLRKTAHTGPLEGSVEEVDTGKQARFSSENELIGFLRANRAHMWRSNEGTEEIDERDDKP